MAIREAYVRGPGGQRQHLGYYEGTELTGGDHLIRGVRTNPGWQVMTANVPEHRARAASDWIRQRRRALGPNR